MFTYLRAKKTILQPIKTEVFKEQVKIFTQIMSQYCGKGEYELRDIFGFTQLFHTNVCQLLDHYAQQFFGLEINKDEKPYSNEKCPHKFVTQEYAEKHLTLVTFPKENSNKENCDNVKNVDNVKIEAFDGKDFINWSEYVYGITSIPNETYNSMKKFEELMNSPFLTNDSIILLKKIYEIIKANIGMVAIVLTSVSQQLPAIYASKESMSDFHWIDNQYNKSFIPIEPSFENLIKYLREYFKVENIMV